MKINKIHQIDCLEGLKRLEDKNVDLIITSPPYAQQRKDAYGGIDEEEYPNWFKDIGNEIFRVLKDKGSFILNIKEHSGKNGRSLYVMKTIIKLVEECNFKLIDIFCWTKNSFPGRIKNKFKNAWEPCYHFAKSTDINIYPEQVAKPIKPESTARAHRKFTGKTQNKSGFQCTASESMRKAKIAYPSNHLAINNIVNQYSDNKWHPAVYPVELCDFFIKALTKENDLVVDIFSGSGTTGVSALNNNRKFMGFEILEDYCIMSNKRLKPFIDQTMLSLKKTQENRK